MTDPTPPGRPSIAAKAVEAAREHPHRSIENVGFVVGVALIGLRGCAEVLQEFGVVQHNDHTGIPWAFFATCALLIAPKALGRATAGKFWEALAAGVGRLVGRGRPAGPREGD